MNNLKKPIQNIVFDLGGVLLDIDYNLTYMAMSEILEINFVPDQLPPAIQEILAGFETGKIQKETFIWNLQRLAQGEVPQGFDIINAWNAMLIGWNPAKFDFLGSLKPHYNIYLLSNTNELHLDWVMKDLKTSHGITNFDETFFDKAYYSHLVGMKKPDKEIFTFVSDDGCLDPGQTLFIDDLPNNIQAATEAGWQTYHHHPADNLIEIFHNKLNLI